LCWKKRQNCTNCTSSNCNLRGKFTDNLNNNNTIDNKEHPQSSNEKITKSTSSEMDTDQMERKHDDNNGTVTDKGFNINNSNIGNIINAENVEVKIDKQIFVGSTATENKENKESKHNDGISQESLMARNTTNSLISNSKEKWSEMEENNNINNINENSSNNNNVNELPNVVVNNDRNNDEGKVKVATKSKLLTLEELKKHKDVNSEPNSIVIPVNESNWFTQYVDKKANNNGDINTNRDKCFSLYNRYIHKRCGLDNSNKKCGCLIEQNRPERVTIISINENLRTFAISVSYKSVDRVKAIKELLNSKNIEYKLPTHQIIRIRFGPIPEFNRLSDEEFSNYFTERGCTGEVKRNYVNGKTQGADLYCFVEQFSTFMNIKPPSGKAFKYQRVIRAEIRLCFHCKATDHIVEKCTNKDKPNFFIAEDGNKYAWCIECAKYHVMQADTFGYFICVNNNLTCRLCNGNHLVRECPKTRTRYDNEYVPNLIANIAKKQQLKEQINFTNEMKQQSQSLNSASSVNKPHSNVSQSINGQVSWAERASVKPNPQLNSDPSNNNNHHQNEIRALVNEFRLEMRTELDNTMNTLKQFMENLKSSMITSAMIPVQSTSAKTAPTIAVIETPTPTTKQNTNKHLKQLQQHENDNSSREKINSLNDSELSFQQMFLQQVEINKKLELTLAAQQRTLAAQQQQITQLMNDKNCTTEKENTNFSTVNNSKKRSKVSTPSQTVHLQKQHQNQNYERSNKYQALLSEDNTDDQDEQDENNDNADDNEEMPAHQSSRKHKSGNKSSKSQQVHTPTRNILQHLNQTEIDLRSTSKQQNQNHGSNNSNRTRRPTKQSNQFDNSDNNYDDSQ